MISSLGTTIWWVVFLLTNTRYESQAVVSKQPNHNELVWSSCSDPKWGHLNLPDRLTNDGLCGKLTFCQRSDKYDDYQFGYQMDDTDALCLSPGPVIRMQPGKTYGLVFCSDNDTEGDHPGSNIHTHGPHIGGSGNGDDITRHIGPDSCGFYEYHIPSNHMGGTQWYHPHLHYHTTEQASGGASGLLIIEDQQRDLTIASSSGTSEQRDDVYDFLTNPDQELLLLAAFDESTDMWVNKNQDDNSLDYNLETGVWYRLRILTVNPDAQPETIQISSECDAYAMAHDGVYRFEVPKQRQEKYYLTGASRIDLAIKCDTPGEYYITNTEGWDDDEVYDDEVDDDEGTSWGGTGWSGSPNIANLIVSDGSTTNSNGPFLGQTSTWNPWTSYRPEYLMDLLSMSPDNTWNVEMSDSSINGFEYDEECPLKDDNGGNFKYDSIQEWTHTSADSHPVHMHMYHQQVVSNCGIGHDIGEYYDTVADASGDSEDCKVRFKMDEVFGRVTLHCHILKHEDAGTMAWVNVEYDPNVANKPQPPISPTEPCCISGHCSACVAEDNLPNNCEL